MLKQQLKDYPLTKAVRNGCCGTNPKTLTRFIDCCLNASDNMPRCDCRQLNIDVLEVLLETICDTLVARCWRGWCLDNIYKPLAYVRMTSKTENEKRELRNIESRLRTFSHYFL